MNLSAMKTYSKTIPKIGTLILLLASSLAFAQSGSTSTPEDRAQRWDTWMKETLLITPEQETRVHDINLTFARQNEKLRTSTESRKDKFKALKLSDKQKDKELQSVLTQEQFELYDQKKKDFQKQLMESLRK